MILSGRVTVGGAIAMIGQSARFGIDEIAVDGIPLEYGINPVYIMLNKPRGYVTTMNDERGRKTVVSLVAGAGVRVYPVGRLDMNSEGLLLMTNDGAFAYSVAHPSSNIKKTYEVCVRGDASAAAMRMRSPMRIDSCTIQAQEASLIKKASGGGVLRISIYEGRNRQIRKMCAHCGLDVLWLKRVSIGALALGSLKTGQWRYLTEEERKSLLKADK